MKLAILLLLCLSSCVEYRLSRKDGTDQYFGWSRSKTALDPKIGPKTKLFFTDSGRFRPYIGGEIIHKEELLLGIGVVYYQSNQVSWEIGYRDSVYKDNTLLDEQQDRDGAKSVSPWDEMNPVIYLGGVLKF